MLIKPQLCFRLHQSSALQSATSPFATALPFSAALPLSPGPRPASPQVDTPRFATLSQTNPRKSMLGEPSHHPRGSAYAEEGSASSYGRSGQTAEHAAELAYRGKPSVSASQHHADRLASSHTSAGVHGPSWHPASPGGSAYPPAADAISPMRMRHSSSPYKGGLSSSSPYRSPAHAAAVSAVEQQLHTSLHEGSGLFASGRAVTSNLAPTSQPLRSRDVFPSRHDREGYHRWNQQASSPTGAQHPDIHLNARQPAVPAAPLQHARMAQPSSEPESLLRPPSQFLHPSPQLDSLSQRLREQKLAMGRQGQAGISPLGARPAYSPGKAYMAHSSAAPNSGAQQARRETSSSSSRCVFCS